MGPYFADSKNNDASILNHMLKTNTEEIRDFIQEDDIFVVDRGFRDSLELLQDLGIRVEMPSILSKGQKQMTCDDANNSRFVTKIRWVVESANARIKSWKYFNHVLPTNQIPYIGDYIRIVCAICNKYFKPLCNADSDDDSRLASKMRALSSNANILKSYVEDNNLERRSALWKPVDGSSLQSFPRFNEEQLRSLTCGVYQLKMSSSYIQEHLDGNCEIHVHNDDSDLIRVRIQSRHTSSRKYLLWIRFSTADIEAWYCKCRAGEHVVAAANGGNYINITLHIFSGRLDPVWTIDHTNRNYQVILDKMINVHSTDLPPILGYKGFRVEVFPNSVLRRTLVIGSCKEPDLEMLLLETVQDLRPVGDSETIGVSTIQQVRQELQHATADGGDNINVTLHIFSGRPDPVWTIHQTNRNYQSILDKMTNVHSTDLPPVLGYKGFTVDVIRNSVLRRTLVIGSCKEPDLEMLLLETVQDLSPIGYTDTIGDSTLQNVKKELQNR